MDLANKTRKARGGSRATTQPVDITDMMICGKVPPQQQAAEAAVLGVIMLEDDALQEVLQILTPAMFYNTHHRQVYQAIMQLHTDGSRVDIITVLAQLEKDLQWVGDRVMVVRLTNDVVSSAHIQQHAQLIKEAWQKREAIRLGGNMVQQGYDMELGAEEILSTASSQIMQVQDTGGTLDEGDLFQDGLALIQELEREPGQLRGLDSGLTVLNAQISGLVEPDLIIIAARPGQGKTAVGCQLAYNLSVMQKIPGAFESLEMSRKQLLRRLWSCDSGISHDRIQRGLLTDDERQRLYKSMQRLASSPLKIHDQGALTIQQLRAKAIRAKSKHGIRWLLVDYLQLMGGRGDNRQEQISEISRGLKALAKELQIPIIALCQLSREVEKRTNKMPQLSDLRESGAIEQDADIVIFLWRPEYYGFKDMIDLDDGRDYHPQDLMVFIISKNRHNAPGKFPTTCRLDISRITDYGLES